MTYETSSSGPSDIGAKAAQEEEALRRRQPQEKINELLAKEDYDGAAVLKATMDGSKRIANVPVTFHRQNDKWQWRWQGPLAFTI